MLFCNSKFRSYDTSTNIAELQHINAAVFFYFRDIAEQLLGGKTRTETVLCLYGGNGAAGRDHQNLLHVSHPESYE